MEISVYVSAHAQWRDAILEREQQLKDVARSAAVLEEKRERERERRG